LVAENVIHIATTVCAWQVYEEDIMTTFPEQDLSHLHGRGVYCPSQWGMPFTPLRYFCGRDSAMYITTYDRLLTCAGSQIPRRLSNFAGVCQTIMAAGNDLGTADDLHQAIGLGLITRLLDMHSLTGLHTRLTYIDELHGYLNRHIAATEAVTGEMTYAAVSDFVLALHKELLRRRDAWKAALRARCPTNAEQLAAVVWHPRHVARHLEAAAGDDAAEEFLMGGWIHEGVGRGSAAAQVAT
jgi:hypothetical protein